MGVGGLRIRPTRARVYSRLRNGRAVHHERKHFRTHVVLGDHDLAVERAPSRAARVLRYKKTAAVSVTSQTDDVHEVVIGRLAVSEALVADRLGDRSVFLKFIAQHCDSIFRAEASFGHVQIEDDRVPGFETPLERPHEIFDRDVEVAVVAEPIVRNFEFCLGAYLGGTEGHHFHVSVEGEAEDLIRPGSRGESSSWA